MYNAYIRSQSASNNNFKQKPAINRIKKLAEKSVQRVPLKIVDRLQLLKYLWKGSYIHNFKKKTECTKT